VFASADVSSVLKQVYGGAIIVLIVVAILFSGSEAFVQSLRKFQGPNFCSTFFPEMFYGTGKFPLGSRMKISVSSEGFGSFDVESRHPQLLHAVWSMMNELGQKIEDGTMQIRGTIVVPADDVVPWGANSIEAPAPTSVPIGQVSDERKVRTETVDCK
jgi:hypothetical protein